MLKLCTTKSKKLYYFRVKKRDNAFQSQIKIVSLYVLMISIGCVLD